MQINPNMSLLAMPAMPSGLRLAIWPAYTPRQSQATWLRALAPTRPGTPTPAATHKILAPGALAMVLLAHAMAFAALMAATQTTPHIEELATPMLVSLVANTQSTPAVARLEPALPKPQPVVIQKNMLQQELKPTPQQQAEEITPSLTSVSKEAIKTEEAAPVAQAKAPEVIEKSQPEPLIEPPRFGAAYLHNPAPAYPTLSRRLGEQGKVVLRVLVTVNGDAEAVQVEAGSSSARLDQAALDAVKQWRFIPAKRNNQPVSAYVLVPVSFSLEG
ncbi:MAG: TonB family protein [Methylophilaceae bacterium]